VRKKPGMSRGMPFVERIVMTETDLDSKRALTRRRFEDALRRAGGEPRAVAVAWTGGKDSTVCLWLWARFLRTRGLDAPGALRALSLDTGFKFPDVLAFRDTIAAEWGVGLIIARPEATPAGFQAAKDVVRCCAMLKIEPLKRAVREHGVHVLLSGVRADEHPSREARPWLEERTNPSYCMAHPILHFTEMDVWALTMEEGLPYCGLYDKGYRSLGCEPCTAPPGGNEGLERAGRDARKENMLDHLRSLGYF